MADTYRILVTGSRDWLSAARLYRVLDEVLAEHGSLILVHGACPSGADKMADNWAGNVHYFGGQAAVTREPHPADWAAHGRAAGFRRNAEMVALGADLCLAFIRNGSRGATHCADLAEKAGIPVRRFAGG